MSENDENLTIVLLRDDPGISNPGDHDVIRSRSEEGKQIALLRAQHRIRRGDAELNPAEHVYWKQSP